MSQDHFAWETILIVDDEESVRKTFCEWLGQAGLGCEVLTAADAASALLQADRHPIDLAILDWNLGAGTDGLHLLEDLYLFNPEIIAIMITGFAHQATPLDAMRMGIRDYLDKNQDLDRETFLRAVRRQIEVIRPAKRERQWHQGLVAFREAIQKVLPLVQSAATLNDPVPLPKAVGSLLRFLQRTTRAGNGVLLVRSYDPGRQPPEVIRVYDVQGSPLAVELVPFSRSLAGLVVSCREPCLLSPSAGPSGGPCPEFSKTLEAAPVLDWQPFERGRQSLLAVPLDVAPGIQAVLELFDKEGPEPGFNQEDRVLAAAAADFGVELLRQALAERQTQQVLFDAAAAALGVSESLAASLPSEATSRPEAPLPREILDSLRQGLSAAAGAPVAPEETLRLAQAMRTLAARHGSAAIRHCLGLVESLGQLLDEMTETGHSS